MTEIKLQGPGTANIMTLLAGLLTAATEACTAFSMKAVAEMKTKEVELLDLHKRRSRLESEVKVLEERKKKALEVISKPDSKPAQQHIRSNTRPLTPEQMALAQVKAEEAAHHRKAEAQAKREAEELRHKNEADARRSAPLTHGIKGLESITIAAAPVEQA